MEERGERRTLRNQGLAQKLKPQSCSYSEDAVIVIYRGGVPLPDIVELAYNP